MLKQILASGALLVGVGAAVVFVLEQTRSHPDAGHLNPMAPVQTRQSIRIQAPAEKVWQLLSRVDHWAAWNPDITGPRLNGALQPGTSFDWHTGGLTIHSTLHTVQPPTALGWSGPAFGTFAVHHWTLTRHDGYTEVLVEEDMEGWLVSLLKPMYQKGLNGSIARWLTCLKQAAERP